MLPSHLILATSDPFTISTVVVVHSPSHVRLCDPTDCSIPGFSVLQYLPEFVQVHVHWVWDASQPSHPLPPSSPFAFSLSQHQGLFQSSGQSIGASASVSVFPMNIYSWFPLGSIGLISLLSEGLKSLLQHHRSNASVLWCSTFFMVQLSHPCMTTGKTITLTRWTFVAKVMLMLFNMLVCLF